MFPNALNTANTTVAITIAPKILWTGFAVVFVFTAIMSVVFLYHWAKYGYKPLKTGAMGSVYLIGVIVLLGIIFFAILSYTNSI